jgi:hypothetical protein
MNIRAAERGRMMTVVLEPTVDDLVRERTELVAGIRSDERDLRERAADYRVTVDESRILRRLDEIDYLLGEDE